MKHARLLKGTAAVALLAGLAAVSPLRALASDHHETQSQTVTVKIIDAKGESIGSATLMQKDDQVLVRVEASKLTPGEHGLHFHETGKCEAPAFTSAGAHFNPAARMHGFNNPKGFHNGDLPNLKVDAAGNAKAEFETKVVTLAKGQPNSLLKDGGTALVIHDKADDYVTDPSGNSGDRIACGVIQ
ncbi:superoxide dismutase family protein [Paenibacillus sp. MWE-103]|uniref:Superoxide dismutase [Cu-Zn] n=1 Tax=Paenibacillus artemisiicola TaxID=1172618 RepID=A0ABS3W2T3_9BACL|nr:MULTISPECIES: superoxide dismutase family protein [Paenibacillus]MBO7742613.1 superoxide dismutase family protein [Paenibacillus artemisiicola]SFI34904.1 superoxide dismutase, Cu-Zn family [Paenibacillus sp. UNC496MF]